MAIWSSLNIILEPLPAVLKGAKPPVELEEEENDDDDWADGVWRPKPRAGGAVFGVASGTLKAGRLRVADAEVDEEEDEKAADPNPEDDELDDDDDAESSPFLDDPFNILPALSTASFSTSMLVPFPAVENIPVKAVIFGVVSCGDGT